MDHFLIETTKIAISNFWDAVSKNWYRACVLDVKVLMTGVARKFRQLHKSCESSTVLFSCDGASIDDYGVVWCNYCEHYRIEPILATQRFCTSNSYFRRKTILGWYFNCAARLPVPLIHVLFGTSGVAFEEPWLNVSSSRPRTLLWLWRRWISCQGYSRSSFAEWRRGEDISLGFCVLLGWYTLRCRKYITIFTVSLSIW